MHMPFMDNRISFIFTCSLWSSSSAILLSYSSHSLFCFPSSLLYYPSPLCPSPFFILLSYSLIAFVTSPSPLNIHFSTPYPFFPYPPFHPYLPRSPTPHSHHFPYPLTILFQPPSLTLSTLFHPLPLPLPPTTLPPPLSHYS